ncbi:MAG TPA: hypothetical protein VH590_04950, partial [Ktedonobacterales bacterium]
MSFYTAEPRCPRCRAPLPPRVPACPNCGLALADAGARAPNGGENAGTRWQPSENAGTLFPQGLPRASRSGPPPSWQPNDTAGQGASSPGGAFDAPRSSGPAVYRPGGQFAPRASGPWGGDAPASSRQSGLDAFDQSGPGYQQRPGAFGSSSGPGGRFVDADDAFTNYQRPQPGQSRPPTGWGDATGGQRPFGSYQQPDPGEENAAGYQRSPTDYRSSPTAWGSNPSGLQRPPTPSRSAYDEYQDWARGGPDSAYTADAGTAYGRQPTFRGASGQSWQQPYAGAPTAYPGSQPAYADSYHAYDPAQDSGRQHPSGRGKKTALIVLVVVLLLGAAGSGAAYLFLRSRPIIGVTSKYMVGTTPAGAASTTLRVTGAQFAAHSAVSFLLDGQPEPGNQIFQSDASGALSGDLTITANWPVGQHTLTARDASGKSTFQGKPIVIVTPGAANTPGPKGAPADDASFTIHVTVHSHNKDTGQKITFSDTLVVTGQPDPEGGTVCSPKTDTGKPQTQKETSNGLRFTETFTIICSGSYKGGKLTYTQTYTSDKIVYSNGVTCKAAAPYVNQKLGGSFTDATSISGTLSSSTLTVICSNGLSQTFKGVDGTWV